MQEGSRIEVPEQTATFTISHFYPEPNANAFFALIQKHLSFEWYLSVAGDSREWDGKQYTKSGRVLWPTLLVCRSPADAFKLRAEIGSVSRASEREGEPFEASEPRFGFRERFLQRVRVEGMHIRQIPSRESFGHVVLDIEPDATLDDVVFENRLPEGGWLHEIVPAVLREAVFRGGPKGYPLCGFRAVLIGGEMHPDGSPRGYRVATLLAVRNALRLSETSLVEVRS